MTRGQKVPAAQRARAVGIAVGTDNISEASRQTGIPESSIREWYNRPEFVELRERTKEVRDHEWSVGVQLAFRRAIDLLEKTDDPVKAATTGAILFDKLALATGNPTSRSETVSHDVDSETRAKIAAWFDEHLDSDTRAADGVPAGDSAEVR